MNTDVSYADAIKSPGVVLIEFYATWCPHCQRMMPIVEQVKKALSGKVPVYQYDIDKYEAVSDAAGVEVVPTFIVFKDGVEKWRHAGELSLDDLLAAACPEPCEK